MSKEKYKDIEEGEQQGSHEHDSAASSRARNRTVMLNPELTGQVRALLSEKAAPQGAGRDPLSDLLPPSWEAPKEGAPIPRSQGTTAYDTEVLHQEAQERFGSGRHPATSIPLEGPKTTAPVKHHAAKPSVRSKIAGFLVSFDKNEHGEIFEIRVGRWLLTSRATDHGDYILIEDETISPLHAIIRATKEGKIQVLDQLSEFGTGVRAPGADKEEEVAGSMVTVTHGSVIRFGDRKFVVCVIPEFQVDTAQAQPE